MRRLNSAVRFRRTNNTSVVVSEEGTSQAASAKSRPFITNLLEARVQKVLHMAESGTALTIRDLAREFRLSPSHLQRLFKYHTGVCMGEWLNQQRLQRAADLLASSYLSVKEIAHNVGYGHASSFIRAFERRYTQAPARYRKQCDRSKC